MLTKITKKAIEMVVQVNDIEYWKLYSQPNILHIQDEEHMFCLSSKIKHPIYNTIITTKLYPNQIFDEIERMKAYFSERRQAWQWLVGPTSTPNNLGDYLDIAGFTRMPDVPFMAIDLAQVASDTPQISGLEIKQVDNAELLKEWITITSNVFEIPQTHLDDFYKLEHGLGFGPQLAVKRYIGLLHHNAVATSAAFTGAGVVGIYWVSTVPDQRNKKIGTTLTKHALIDACKHGYRVGVLQSEPKAANVYRRIGFKEYGKIQVYYIDTASK